MSDEVGLIRAKLRSVVIIRSSLGIGSGFYVSSSGLIVTNRHVVGPLLTVQVQRHDRRQVDTRVVRVATSYDLALLWDQSGGSPAALPLGDSAAVSAGQTVFAIGHPAGLEFTVSRGIVSAADRLVNGAYHVQTDATSHPGSSGGPLLDGAGNVVGVSTLGLRVEGLNFALSVRYVHELLGEVMVKPGVASATGRRCESCGTKNLAVRRSCRKCGMSLEGAPLMEDRASVESPAPTSAPPSAPPNRAAARPPGEPTQPPHRATRAPHHVAAERDPVVAQIVRALDYLTPRPESVSEVGSEVEITWKGCTVNITVFPHAQEPHLAATSFVANLPGDDAPRVMRRALEANMSGSLEAKLGLRGSQMYAAAERALVGLDDPEVRALVHRVVEVRRRFLADVISRPDPDPDTDPAAQR